MNGEKDFFKTCFNTVVGLEVKNESQAIAKEVVLSEIKNLQQENKQLKDNWNKLKDYIVKEYYMYLPLEASTRSITILIDKMHELEQGSDNQ